MSVIRILQPPKPAGWRRLGHIVVLLSYVTGPVFAQSCPDAGASLVSVKNAISDMGKSGRAPAASDCALAWASGMNLDSRMLSDQGVVGFFTEAADLHRRAAEVRQSAARNADADRYLANEVALRKKFLEVALRAQTSPSDDALRRATVQHLSALSGALARRQQYAEVDKVLANTDASVIDEEAVSVWLQAVWSCAKFDGKTSNLCVRENQDVCRDKVAAFLSSVGEMKNRRFPPQTQRDIQKLKKLTAHDGCLR